MAPLRISFFGTIRISRQPERSDFLPCRSAQALLAYLVLYRGRAHAREKLLGVFWPNHDETRGRACLNSALWRVRQALEVPGTPRGQYILSSPRGDVSFNDRSSYWLDVAEFEDSLSEVCQAGEQPLPSALVEKAEAAFGLYVGDLLEGFYEDWALRERERLRLLYISCLSRLLQHYRLEQANEKAIACADRILRCDPLREAVHRELMRLYLESGQREMAVRQFLRCRQLLAEQLGIAPMEETQRLAGDMVTGEVGGGADKPGPWQADYLLSRLTTAVTALDAGRANIVATIDTLRNREGRHVPSSPPPIASSDLGGGTSRRNQVDPRKPPA